MHIDLPFIGHITVGRRPPGPLPHVVMHQPVRAIVATKAENIEAAAKARLTRERLERLTGGLSEAERREAIDRAAKADHFVETERERFARKEREMFAGLAGK